jgi:D-alanyl-D-alanine carboxypeptidase
MATGAWTAGAWAGTTEALARWADRLFRGEILEPESLSQMTDFRPAPAVMWGEFGLGLSRRMEEGEEVWGHSGYAPGVHTELWHLPQRGLTLFTVSNDDLIGAADHQRALLRVALEKL